MRLLRYSMIASAAALSLLSLGACVDESKPTTTAPTQAAMKSEAAAATPGPFASVEGLTCRGYYKLSEGGSGHLSRPESAFKIKVENGKFRFWAARAEPGASNGWDTASGNWYLDQGNTGFDLQPNGSWHFKNPAAGSNYYLTPISSDEPTVKKFTIRYEADEGWSVGKARCTAS